MPPSSSTSTSRWTLGTAGLLLSALGIFNYVIDPFQQYRLSKEPRYWHALQRYIVPGLAKHAGYETVLLGSSMFEGFVNSEASAALGGPARNLSLSAISAYEMGLMLEVIFQHARPLRIVIDLNVNSYAGPTNKRWVDDPLPLYLWDRNPLNDVRYLWSLETFEKSLAIATRKPGRAPRYYKDHNQPWAWTTHETFAAREVTKGLNPANLNERYKQSPRTAEEMIDNFKANLLPWIRLHPETRFDLLHPPYSVLAWIDFEQRKQVEVTLEWKRRLFHLVKTCPNVAIYDFQGAPLTDDLDNYKDIYHFSGAVSSWMLRELAGSSAYRVTDRNMEEMLEQQGRRAKTRDVKRLLGRVDQ